jgi:hypothetical protein
MFYFADIWYIPFIIAREFNCLRCGEVKHDKLSFDFSLRRRSRCFEALGRRKGGEEQS